MKHLKAMTPVQPKPPSKDEGLQKLKSEIELLVTSGQKHIYKSPEEEFKEHLLRDFADDHEAISKIHSHVAKLRAKDPFGFTSGKHHTMNIDLLVSTKEAIRKELGHERHERAEATRIELERKEQARKDKIQKEWEAKLKRQPWLKDSPSFMNKSPKKEREEKPFELGFSLASSVPAAKKDALFDLGTKKDMAFGRRVDDEKRFTGSSARQYDTDKDKKIGHWDFGLDKGDQKDKAKIKVKSRDNSLNRSNTGGDGGNKSATRLVKEMVGRKSSADNMRASASESNIVPRPNKPLVALTGTKSPTAPQPPKPNIPTIPTGDKKTKQQELDNFFKKNYGGAK
jgi:hypothetical protein